MAGSNSDAFGARMEAVNNRSCNSGIGVSTAGDADTCLGSADISNQTSRARSSPGTFAISAPASAVPTLSEWAMILLGLALAGGTAAYLQRRCQTVG